MRIQVGDSPVCQGTLLIWRHFLKERPELLLRETRALDQATRERETRHGITMCIKVTTSNNIVSSSDLSTVGVNYQCS